MNSSIYALNQSETVLYNLQHLKYAHMNQNQIRNLNQKLSIPNPNKNLIHLVLAIFDQSNQFTGFKDWFHEENAMLFL